MTPDRPTTPTRLRVTAVALFILNDEVLLLHQMTPPEPDCWDLPGGGIEPEETMLEALKREVWEETGITDFRVDRLLTIADHFCPDPRNPEQTLHTVNVVYQCTVVQKPAQLRGDEIEVGPKGIQWLAIDSLMPEVCSYRAWQALLATDRMTQ